MSMNIKIVQPEPEDAGDLEFTQPKYYFGQMLEDEEGDIGFVVQMSFQGYWRYALLYTKLDSLGGWIPEHKLATATINQANSQLTSFQQLLKPQARQLKSGAE